MHIVSCTYFYFPIKVYNAVVPHFPDDLLVLMNPISFHNFFHLSWYSNLHYTLPINLFSLFSYSFELYSSGYLLIRYESIDILFSSVKRTRGILLHYTDKIIISAKKVIYQVHYSIIVERCPVLKNAKEWSTTTTNYSLTT